MMVSLLGGEGEREGDEGEEPPHHDRRLNRREKEALDEGQGRGVTEPGVVDGVDVVRDESRLVVTLGSLAKDSTLLRLRSSSSHALIVRCTVILGLFRSSAIKSLDSRPDTCCSRGSSGVVQPEESGGEMSTRSSAGAMRSASEKLPLIVTMDGFV